MNPSLDIELSKLRIDKSRKRGRRGGWGKIFFFLVLAGAAGGGYAYYQKSNSGIEVKVAKPLVETTANTAALNAPVVVASGYIIPRKTVEVSSQIVGRVKEILVERGARVNAGDILLRLKDDEYAAQVRMNEAQLAVTEAKLAELKAGSRPEEKAAARATVAAAQATRDQAQLDLDRAVKLFQDRVIARQDWDKARTAFDVAEANLKSAQKSAELVEAGPRREQIDAAAAQARQLKANLDYAQTQLDYTVIRAPISGIILEKVAETGELVTNINFGGTRGAKSSVVTMADLGDLQAEVDLNENDLRKIHLGQKCDIRLDSSPDLTIQGQVDEIAPQADRQKATVQVKARLVDPPSDIRIDVNARVMFLADAAPSSGSMQASAAGATASSETAMTAARSVIWIPRAAVSGSGEDRIVYIAAQGKAIARKVKTGLEGEKGVLITEGLAGNESLIIEPVDKVSDGAKIAVKQQEKF